MNDESAQNPFAAPEAGAGVLSTTKPPYSPRAVGFMSFFFSFLVGGILLGVNYERLGQPEKKISCIAITIVGFVAYMVVVWFIPEGSIFDRAANWVNIGIAIAIAQVQKEAYQAHVEKGGETASPWPLVGILVAIVAVLLAGFVGLLVWSGEL